MTTSDSQSLPLPRFADARFAGLRLLSGVSPGSIAACLEDCDQRDLAAGELLLSPQTPNDKVYAILSGSLAVHLRSLDGEPLTVLGPGLCAGEMSIIEQTDPSAFVVANEPTRVLVIDHERLWELIDSSHAFARNLLAILSERVRTDNDIIADNAGVLRQYELNAMTDALTALNNRHWMEDMFRRRLQRCKGDGESASLVMLDIDFFKHFNDDHGHLAGDHALCTVADALRACSRPTDMVARYGGDEFAVLLPATTVEDAMDIAERMRAEIAAEPGPRQGPQDGRGLTISLGVAEMSGSESLEMLLNNADAALYRAKLAGRNCVRS